jgi:hypothetical protein
MSLSPAPDASAIARHDHQGKPKSQRVETRPTDPAWHNHSPLLFGRVLTRLTRVLRVPIVTTSKTFRMFISEPQKRHFA